MAPEGRPFHAYNEYAWRYLLTLERERAGRSSRPVLLVLVSLGRRSRIPATVAQRVFTGLWLGTRETDFIGWFRDGRIAGAVLTQRPDALVGNARPQIRARVVETIREALPRPLRLRLCVHVLALRPPPQPDTASALVPHDCATGL